MSSPNLFIIGAPKCGTTALATYLGRHPSVFMSVPKEPHYFCEDFPKMRSYTDLDEYQKLFIEATDEHKVIGEASVWYLYSKVAVPNIYQYRSDAKVIIMLRNPVDMVYSMHSQNVNSADEDVVDFHTAWQLQDQRAAGSSISRHCREPAKLLYGEIGKLGAQVEAVLKVFPREQVKLILFDDFIKNTGQVYDEVLDFLGLEHIGGLSFEPINTNEVSRFRWLTVFTRRPPRFLVDLSQGIKRLLGLERLGIIDRLVNFNQEARKRQPLTAEFRAELQQYFKADIDHLSSQLGRDLSVWYEGKR